MKNKFFLFLIFYVSLNYAQDLYKKGYLVENNGEKYEVFIKSEKWTSTPTYVDYVKDTYNLIHKDDLKEFGTFDGYKFVKYDVNIDRSTVNTSTTSKPDFHKELLFLQQIFVGPVNLYVYRDEGFYRFFYQLKDEIPQQLVYKKYTTYYHDERDNETTKVVKENNYYKFQLQQIFNDCVRLTQKDFNIKYKTPYLLKLFQKYAKCKGEAHSVLPYKNVKLTDENSIKLSLKTHVEDFDEAYYITNENKRIEGYIKRFNENEPVKYFYFKKTYKEAFRKINISEAKAFTLFDKSHYESFVIDDPLSFSKDTTVIAKIKDTAFLKVLLKGYVSLYVYGKHGTKYYYFQKENLPLQLLVDKKSKYKRQLKQIFSDNPEIYPLINKTSYKDKDLIVLFEKYNRHIRKKAEITSRIRRFKIWFELRGMISKADIRKQYDKDYYTKLATLDFIMNFSASYKLLKNNDNFYLFAAPYYFPYRKFLPEITVPVGLRYKFVSKRSPYDFFVSAFYATNFLVDKDNISPFIKQNDVQIKSRTSNLGIGFGWIIKNKLSFTVQYYFSRDIFYPNEYGIYSSISRFELKYAIDILGNKINRKK